VPWAIANAACEWRRRNPAVPEIPNRGHSRTIDHGRRGVRATAFLHARATSRRGMAVFGALTGLTTLAALLLGIVLAG
jgi:hypothetical protein